MLDELQHSEQIADLTDRLLKKAGAYGRFPTPVDDIVSAANLTESKTSALSELFLKRAPAHIRKAVAPLTHKIRAILDRREKVIHLHPEIEHKGRREFKVLHEVSHEIYPWQSSLAYADDRLTLSWSAKLIFEREANQGAAELFFQGELFRAIAADYEVGFAAILDLAHKFGASIHATFRRYVETHRDPLAGIVLPIPGSANGTEWRRREAIQSASLQRIVGPAYWPAVLTDPPFTFLSALKPPLPTRIVDTEIDLPLKGAEPSPLRLQVETFSNSYCVLVLLWQPTKKAFKKRVTVDAGAANPS